MLGCSRVEAHRLGHSAVIGDANVVAVEADEKLNEKEKGNHAHSQSLQAILEVVDHVTADLTAHG